MRFSFFSLLWSFLFLFSVPILGEVPRTILVLYHSEEEEPTLALPIKAEDFVEMPLNQLGLKMIKHDLKEGLPDYGSYKDLRGIFIWLDDPSRIDRPVQFLEDLRVELEKGIKFVSFGWIPFTSKNATELAALEGKRNEVLHLLGLETEGNWVEKDYRVNILSKSLEMVGFEHPIDGYVAPYDVMTSINGKSYLTVSIPDEAATTTSTIVHINDRGGYVCPQWSIYDDPSGKREARQWLINPFLFFRASYQTRDLPKPDPTTLVGRRIFYSQIDGDGFYNVTYISPYSDKGKLSTEMLMDEVFAPNPEVPFTFGVIAAEIDPTWVATEAGIEVARKILALPNIEVGNHTLSHPFYWGFFENYKKEDEIPFLKDYRYGTWVDPIKNSSRILTLWKHSDQDPNLDTGGEYLPTGFTIPRAYANFPFNLDEEITGSIERINRIVAPPGKKCSLYQWSGNCRPFEAALRFVRDDGIANINGGDSRFDSQYPSYSWVSAIGRLVGDEQQIFASASNENTYTNLWTDKFFAYKEVLQTYWNTNVPIRVKPVDLYFHCYSGERIGSLMAVKSNVEAIKKMGLCFLKTSHYSRIADGFYSTSFEVLGEKKWRVSTRGELQTIRFDEASELTVDWSGSKGIIGQQHFQGSLYVFLEPKDETPEIALKPLEALVFEEPLAEKPYLLESRSPIWNFQTTADHFSFETEGFGYIESSFLVPKVGRYEVLFGDEHTEVESEGHVLKIAHPKMVKEVTCRKL